MKALIVIALVGIVGALASAGVLMLRGKHDPARADNRMARALAVRVGLSIALFLFILLGWRMGWIQPSGLPLSR